MVESLLRTAEGRELVQRRLAQLCAVMFWAFAILLVFVFATYWFFPPMRPAPAARRARLRRRLDPD